MDGCCVLLSILTHSSLAPARLEATLVNLLSPICIINNASESQKAIKTVLLCISDIHSHEHDKECRSIDTFAVIRGCYCI